MNRYVQPASLPEALALRAEQRFSILAGGTDFYPARVDRPIAENVLDISRIASLKTIEEHADHFRIGALVTWSQLLATPLPGYFDGLKLAAREVGGVQIQNRGTIVGNVCNASPAADGVPALLSMDARVEAQSYEKPAAQNSLFLFINSAKKTVLLTNEIATALIIPKPKHAAVSAFAKTGARTYLLISTAMVATTIEHEQGAIVQARIAVGACSAVAQRLPELEKRLIGKPMEPSIAALVETTDFSSLTPIDDVRASASYRTDCAMTLTQRVLVQLTKQSS